MRFDPKEPGRNILLHVNGLSLQKRGLISGVCFLRIHIPIRILKVPILKADILCSSMAGFFPELVQSERLLLRPVRIKESFL